MKLLQLTEQHFDKKVRLPVVKDKSFYPTEASVKLDDGTVVGSCLRANYFRSAGGFVPSPYSSYSQWIFFTGKAVEESLVEHWKQMGIWVDNNIKFRSPQYKISGELDVVLLDPETEELILVEVKTYYGYQATKELMGNPYKNIAGQPKDQNLLQILIYLFLHQHIFKRGKLIYIEKVCKNHIEFDISLVKEGDNTYPVINGIVKRRFSIEQVLERYKELEKYLDNKELPERDFELSYSSEKIEQLFKDKEISKTKYEKWKKKGVPIGDWNCAYCNFKSVCYDIDPAELPDPDTDESE